MRKDRFDKFVDNQLERLRLILQKKGHDYNAGEEDYDRLGNFKRIAKELGVEPLLVWFVYFKKHVDSVTTRVRTGRQESEPFADRCLDLIGYALLGAALETEREELEKMEVEIDDELLSIEARAEFATEYRKELKEANK